ncbi:MAG: glutamate synthase-related protein, partial [Dehalococcoidia bacterium]|nr:glutamate synthase-related protein [Dehalococcoidia bacterium]
ALALGADAVAIGIAALLALNCNKETPESNFEEEIGAVAGQCHHCHTGKCPVGIATQDPALVARLDPDEAAERVANFINSMTMEMALITRSLGKGDVHSLEPEDMAALTIEASAMARVPLVGTDKVFGL